MAGAGHVAARVSSDERDAHARPRRRGVRPKLSGDPQSREIRIEQNHTLAVGDLPSGGAEVSEVDDRSARFHVRLEQRLDGLAGFGGRDHGDDLELDR